MPNTVYSFDSIAQLRAAPTPSGCDVVEVAGYYGVNTPGGGVFRLDAADTTSADDGGMIIVDASGGRWKRDYEGDINVAWYGAKNDYSTDCTAQIQAAINFSNGLPNGQLIFFPPGTYRIDGQLTITQSHTGFYSEPNRQAANLVLSYVGNAITIGGSTSQTQTVNFSDINFSGAPGQTLFFTRYLRALRFDNCKINADRMFLLGDASLGYNSPTYILHMVGCEINQFTSPTFDFVTCANFRGQFVFIDSFCEGPGLAGNPKKGFETSGNLGEIDHVVVLGGYWSRFDINWDFVDINAVNLYFIGHHSELGKTSAYRFLLSSAAPSDLTIGSIRMVGCTVNAQQEAIVINNASPSGAINQIEIADLVLNGPDPVSSAILIKGQDGLTARILVDGVVGTTHPLTANTVDFIKLLGSDTATTLQNIIVDNISATAAKPIGGSMVNNMRSVLRIQGAMNKDIRQGGNLVGVNANGVVSDVTGSAQRSPTGTLLKSATVTWPSIAAHASSSQSVSVPGARAASDIAFGNIVSGSVPASTEYRFAVVADDNVQITCTNNDTVAHTPSGLGFRLEVRQYG